MSSQHLFDTRHLIALGNHARVSDSGLCLDARLEKMVARELLGRGCWICSTTKAHIQRADHCHPEKKQTGCPFATDPGPTRATGAATGAGTSGTPAMAGSWHT